MIVVDALKIGNEVFAFCIGEDLPKTLPSDKIKIDGHTFHARGYDPYVSLVGNKAALILLDVSAKEDVPLGELILQTEE